MKIIISPAKKMNRVTITPLPLSVPVYSNEAKELHGCLAQLSYEQLKTLYGCNDTIAQLNYDRIHQENSDDNGSPALLAYDGIQYKYMAPHIFEDDYFTYVQDKVRILSGLYGVLKPFDCVVPYRLEMQAKLQTEKGSTLYSYWEDKLYKEVVKEDDVLLNLASDEYSKCIKRYVEDDVLFVTCVFGELQEGKVKEKGVYVKMARGEMVRYMAENNIQKIEEIKTFTRLGFCFSKSLSNDHTYIFLKK